jgi:hypothetical protein
MIVDSTPMTPNRIGWRFAVDTVHDQSVIVVVVAEALCLHYLRSLRLSLASGLFIATRRPTSRPKPASSRVCCCPMRMYSVRSWL